MAYLARADAGPPPRRPSEDPAYAAEPFVIYQFGPYGFPLAHPNTFKRGTGDLVAQMIRSPPEGVQSIAVGYVDTPFLLSFNLRDRSGTAYAYNMQVFGLYAFPQRAPLYEQYRRDVREYPYASKNELVDVIRQMFPAIQATLPAGGPGAGSYEGGRRNRKRRTQKKSAKRKHRTYR